MSGSSAFGDARQPVADPADAIDIDRLRRAAAGDEPAFAALVEAHQARVYRLARALTATREEAEDVLQQTFLSAWRSAGQYRGEASVRTWLLTIARHAAWRTAGRQRRMPLDDRPIEELGLAAGWGADDPERLAIAAEERRRVATALARLDPHDREILVLRDVEGLSGDETAGLLGLGLAAMKSRLHRARLRLAAAVRTEVPHAPR